MAIFAKENISFDSREKIYHVPGGEYYNETVIRPDLANVGFVHKLKPKLMDGENQRSEVFFQNVEGSSVQLEAASLGPTRDSSESWVGR